MAHRQKNGEIQANLWRVSAADKSLRSRSIFQSAVDRRFMEN
jgi:hypothetical protein